MASQDDLQYTADQLRDWSGGEEKVQATMQEETAIALHRVAEAIEELTEEVRSTEA